ncbi:hypothetical protein IJL65_05740 [bacterium]|nr:hypothetical protein [bacterium]
MAPFDENSASHSRKYISFHGTFFTSTSFQNFVVSTFTASFSYFLMNLSIASSTAVFLLYDDVLIALIYSENILPQACGLNLDNVCVEAFKFHDGVF